jgi:hypothetical protein
MVYVDKKTYNLWKFDELIQINSFWEEKKDFVFFAKKNDKVIFSHKWDEIVIDYPNLSHISDIHYSPNGSNFVFTGDYFGTILFKNWVEYTKWKIFINSVKFSPDNETIVYRNNYNLYKNKEKVWWSKSEYTFSSSGKNFILTKPSRKYWTQDLYVNWEYLDNIDIFDNYYYNSDDTIFAYSKQDGNKKKYYHK